MQSPIRATYSRGFGLAELAITSDWYATCLKVLLGMLSGKMAVPGINHRKRITILMINLASQHLDIYNSISRKICTSLEKRVCQSLEPLDTSFNNVKEALSSELGAVAERVENAIGQEKEQPSGE